VLMLESETVPLALTCKRVGMQHAHSFSQRFLLGNARLRMSDRAASIQRMPVYAANATFSDASGNRFRECRPTIGHLACSYY